MYTGLPYGLNNKDLPKVEGYDGVLRYPTTPNSREVVFEANDDIFYVIETDINNYKTKIDRYRFYPESIEDVNDKKYASKEEINEIKEILSNVQQSIQQLSSNKSTDVTTNANSDRSNSAVG